jgi:hypothetical protein
MKRRINLGRVHPPTQQVKAALRELLAEQPDDEVAWILATIIQNGLAHTDLLFDAPSDGGRTKQVREDPSESFATLSAVLETCFQLAPPNSELSRKSGAALARLRLLQGDWAGMNAVLEKLGRLPVPGERRPTLPAPPPDWSNLERDWQVADESMRSGNCAIEFQFEKDGKGLAGAHVLIKRPREPGFSTGIRVDTLLHATLPMEDRLDFAFGYYSSDRGVTRYAVSDATDKVRIENVPKIPVVVEVLIPTSNFAEPGVSWDLMMEVAPGDVRPTSWQDAGSIRGKKDGPSIAELRENETIHYPKLIVRPQFAMDLAEWSSVAADNFVLEWQSLAGGNQHVDHYELGNDPHRAGATAEYRSIISGHSIVHGKSPRTALGSGCERSGWKAAAARKHLLV